MKLLLKLAAFAIVLLALFTLVLGLALRNNPAREAIGTMATTPSQEATIEYYASGPDRGETVVLLPSFARAVSDFNELVPVLNEAGYRTLAIQFRGVEGSTLPDSDMTLHDYAADVKAVLDKEQVVSALVVAHAYGNRVARTFAHDYPGRSHGLVLLAAGGEEPTPKATSRAIIKAQLALLPASMRKDAVDFAFFAAGNPVPPWWVRGWYPRAGLAQANATRAMRTQRTDPAWAGAGNDPMVILEPAEDAAAAGAGESLRRRYPERVQLHIVPDAGHALLPEQPDLTARLVLEALSGFEQ